MAKDLFAFFVRKPWICVIAHFLFSAQTDTIISTLRPPSLSYAPQRLPFDVRVNPPHRRQIDPFEIETRYTRMFRFIASIAVLCALIVACIAPSNVIANNSSAPSASSFAACPFCSAIALTFSEQLGANDIAVVAKLIEIPPPSNDPNADFPKAKFEIVQVLKGEKFVDVNMSFKTQLVGTYPKGQKFLVMGVDPPKVAWTTPMKASDRVFKYLNEIQDLPESGGERLVFFQNYFEDEESVLAFDAYDEFARAPYADLIAMKDQMEREKLIGWIKDTDTSVSRKRLYFTMLGVCGKKEDTELLEDLITSGSRKKRAGLDALIACYLTLKGESGVDLIEKTFLADQEVDYVDTLAAVSALRFHGTEVDIIPKKRIVIAVRHLLDRPKMADMIIPDLARWEDWSVMERLVQMFKDADTDSNWLRVPVITYLRACPKPEAKTYIEELRKIDPESVQRADFFLGVGDDDWGDDEAENTEGGGEEKDSVDSGETGEGTSESAGEESQSDDGADKYVVMKVALDSEEQQPPPPSTIASPADEPNGNESLAGTQTVSTTANHLPSTKTSANIVPEPNLESSALVSKTADSMAAQSNPAQIAQSVTPSSPIAATTPSYELGWQIILIPMAASVAIFLLLWSVVNGWFERLIF